MLDKLIGGYGHGCDHKDHRSSGYGFQEHKEFVSHEETEGRYFDRQAHYDRHMRLPVNHGRPPMAHMPVCDEDDSDSDVEFFESSRSHHTTGLPHHNNNHHQQPPHLNFMPPSPMAQPHHNGKMGNGWQGRHEDAYHGGHGMKHQDKLMAPQVPPHHVYMNPGHGSGNGRAVVVKATENWRVSNNSGGHHKAGWGSKGL